MKPTHRKAIYFLLAFLLAVITAPLGAVALVTSWICSKVADLADALKNALRIYDKV